MGKRMTVFYSWQSDTPSNLNRNFIEQALVEALKRLHSDATLESALRDTTIELDKDTLGVSGSPPIADTILRKIEECAAFVADLTFVGESKASLLGSDEKPRQFPNPNVLIEHGYAIRSCTHAGLIGVMNTAYGKPDADSLPFDLRHLRWPITYHLESTSTLEKSREFEKLVKSLAAALQLIFSKFVPVSPVASPFIPQKATLNAAVFHTDPTELIPEQFGNQPTPIFIPSEGLAYLRLYTTSAIPGFETELEAATAASIGGLAPMGRVQGWSPGRNVYGGIVYDSPRGGRLYNFTQLFLSRELWGVDALSFT